MVQEIKIAIECEDEDERDMILDRIVSQIKEGYRLGFDRNDNGSYRFSIIG